MTIEHMPLDRLREYYRQIRNRSEAYTHAEFDAAVRAHLVKHGHALEEGTEVARAYVRAARKVKFMCRRCAGTGRFITMVENGQPKGPGGICFRCAGKGVQNDYDVRRNEEHDKHYLSHRRQ